MLLQVEDLRFAWNGSKPALLDPASQQEIVGLLRRLTQRPERPLAALWVTHRLEELAACDGAALMDAGRVGPWQTGVALQRQLLNRQGALPGGGAKR